MHRTKFISIFIFIFLIGSILLPGEFLKVGAYTGFFSPRDETLNEIYGAQDVIYGLKIGAKIWKGLYVYLAGMQYNKVSQTSLLEDATSITLNPISLSLRYTFKTGVLNPYLEGGFTYMFFKEKSDIGSIEEKGNGYSIDTGVEITLSKRFLLDIGVKYSSITVNPTGFQVDLGGIQAGIAFLVII